MTLSGAVAFLPDCRGAADAAVEQKSHRNNFTNPEPATTPPMRLSRGLRAAGIPQDAQLLLDGRDAGHSGGRHGSS
ncbi:hypothetical protein ACFP76_15540 [Paracoccus aerius]|uniref:hypothetical protein n=1 Tax=Paracoccus aerius TaxID=1915382 RepID=UPI00360AD0A6